MAGEDIVIVNFEALESAINTFTTSANHIADITSNLRSNAQAIQGAVVSQASDIYASKMDLLVQSFGEAEQRLITEDKTLETLKERAVQANQTAVQIAGGVTNSSFFME